MVTVITCRLMLRVAKIRADAGQLPAYGQSKNPPIQAYGMSWLNRTN